MKINGNIGTPNWNLADEVGLLLMMHAQDIDQFSVGSRVSNWSEDFWDHALAKPENFHVIPNDFYDRQVKAREWAADILGAFGFNFDDPSSKQSDPSPLPRDEYYSIYLNVGRGTPVGMQEFTGFAKIEDIEQMIVKNRRESNPIDWFDPQVVSRILTWESSTVLQFDIARRIGLYHPRRGFRELEWVGCILQFPTDPTHIWARAVLMDFAQHYVDSLWNLPYPMFLDPNGEVEL